MTQYLPINQTDVKPFSIDTVKVLFPQVQLAICIALTLSVASITSTYLLHLYTATVLLWATLLTYRLVANYTDRVRLCSRQSALSILAAGWHVPIAWQLGAPLVMVLAGWILLLMAFYGWRCHGH